MGNLKVRKARGLTCTPETVIICLERRKILDLFACMYAFVYGVAGEEFQANTGLGGTHHLSLY